MTDALRPTIVTLGVADVARSRAFYEALGYKASAASQVTITFIDTGGVILALFGRAALAHDAGVSDSTPGFSGVTLARNTATEADVARLLDAAVAAGGRLVKPATRADWGGLSGYFADPDGHLWEIAHNPFFPLNGDGHPMLPPPEA